MPCHSQCISLEGRFCRLGLEPVVPYSPSPPLSPSLSDPAYAQVADFGKKQTGLDQYAIARFAEALEVVPRTIAENSGLPATEVMARLYAAHSAGQVRCPCCA